MTDIVNHIALLLDRSGSMAPLAGGVIKQYNLQAKQISEQAAQSGQKTHLSLYAFSDVADQPILVEVPLDLVDLKPLDEKTYSTDGMTAMLDSIGLAVDQLSRFERGRNDSFLVIVLTDGKENHSKKYGWASMGRLIKEKMATDIWTFAFLVPVGDKKLLLSQLSVYDGNVREWDQTAKGVEAYSKATADGLNAFFRARAVGKRSVSSFFTDLSHVSTTQVASNLDDVTRKYAKHIVTDNDCDTVDQHGNKAVVIEKFCRVHFGEYVIGNAFYELMKREKVQDSKTFVIEDRTTNRMYGGDQARDLLGFPRIGQVSVAPGDHGKFRIYVKSTSVNRKLVKGQMVAYKEA